MAKWVPKDMEWFLADLIQQFTFVDGSHSIYVNTLLVKATSVEQAYEKALGFGEVYNHNFTNTDQEEVKSSFRGLRDLYLIYETLEDGAELIYEEFEEITEEEIAAIVTPKEKLAAFEKHGPEQSVTVTPKQTEALQ
ncbi:MAG TPA: DUF4288 domain-containing protein [Terracidiphilus sp.]|jgi:hypothetical protein|nr:DUF4288 domain-containing protein [Terracidiphilus sp.]